MEGVNHSRVSEFVLLGLTDSPQLQIFLFVMFSVFYLMTMLGNCLILLTVLSTPHLHSPMYFLLSNLSLIDICLPLPLQRWSWTSLLSTRPSPLRDAFLRSSFCTSSLGLKLCCSSPCLLTGTLPYANLSIIHQLWAKEYVLGLWQLLGQWASCIQWAS